MCACFEEQKATIFHVTGTCYITGGLVSPHASRPLDMSIVPSSVLYRDSYTYMLYESTGSK